MRVFAGYAGWGSDQLEDEIDEGAWFVVDAEPGDLSADDPERLWEQVLRDSRRHWPSSPRFPRTRR